MISIQIKKTLRGAHGPFDLELDLNIPSQQFTTITGPSGAGKTSLLRILAGLMTATSGKIEIQGDTWFDSSQNINLKPQQRNVGFVFQDFALFPNMTVRENLEYAASSANDKSKIQSLMEIIGLENLQKQKPHLLSGGQQQRVALARALVRQPKLLLLDEPLSALDQEMRSSLQKYLKDIHDTLAINTILISHDTSEIIRLSDTVFVLREGRIESSGSPLDIYTNNLTSGKFQIVGEVLSIKKESVIYIVTILSDSNVMKVVCDPSSAQKLKVGDKVLAAAKAFNPILQKLH